MLEKSRPAEIKKVKIKDEFWTPYLELVRDTVLPYQWDILNDRISDAEPSHAVQNFRIAAEMENGEFHGEVFQDSDLAKWLEAAAYTLENCPNPELEKEIDDVVEIIIAAQQENGYLDTYFTIKCQEKEWTNLYECHELYCAGHMIEAAVAYYKATGKRRFLDAVCRTADCIDQKFGKEQGKLQGYPGHQEIELALVKLYEVTGERKYLALSKYFLEERGKQPNYFVREWETTREKNSFKTDTYVSCPNLLYNQAHRPVLEQENAVGHSVRAMYMYSAMADVAREDGSEEFKESCRRLWNSTVNKQMYITGAIGSTHIGEAFTFDYDLPNETAYAETCASVGLIYFAHRMLKLQIDGSYADEMERALYNVILSSMSNDGKQYFYVNPLEIWPEACEKNPERFHVKTRRQKWFGCACCPPNIARLLSSLGQYIYSYGENTVYVHLYIGSEVEIKAENGKYRLCQSSQYPWKGKIEIEVQEVPREKGCIALRIPGWCRKWQLTDDNEKNIVCEYKDGYAYIKNVKAGQSVVLDISMQAELVQANPQVRADAGRVAIQRGPLIFCLEECDNGNNLHALRIDAKKTMELIPIPGMPEKVEGIVAAGYRMKEDGWENNLYRPYQLEEEVVKIRAVPYFMWGNRTAGEMLVWIRVS